MAMAGPQTSGFPGLRARPWALLSDAIHEVNSEASRSELGSLLRSVKGTNHASPIARNNQRFGITINSDARWAGFRLPACYNSLVGGKCP
jgi:hypothetical protein